MNKRSDKKHNTGLRKRIMVLYDLAMLLLVDLLILVLYPSSAVPLPPLVNLVQILLGALCILGSRHIFRIYQQVWRFGGTPAYIRLILADLVAGFAYFFLQRGIPIRLGLHMHISFIRALSIVALNLLGSISLRLLYQYLYEYSSQMSSFGRALRWLAKTFTGLNLMPSGADKSAQRRIRIAIVGAGRVGVMLAEELLTNPNANYLPYCFIDIDQEKIGREIFGLRVLSEAEATPERIADMPVQEIVFALPKASSAQKNKLYNLYKTTGLKIKVYDYPLATQAAETGKRHMREFDIEELLFRQAQEFTSEKTREYYRGKTILISGGSGSIGSELCRQLVRMQPKKLIILDIYENSSYDIQQELRIAHGSRLDLQVEIASVCDRPQLNRIFERHRPDVVLHAAAHKHVPLMEHNCCEAVRNNVFGTLNIVEAAEQYGVKKFIMISTDKAVNPTNIMGATKRMCEMIVQSRSGSDTVFSATRFGNVLGSNGSVIPLFKRQIANGGPVTLTDRRIIRYFMTIPEATQLVLESGAMAVHGELFALDMGKPVKILELAENMIRLSGFEPYKDIDIIETGLRPGEKLYEELLIQSEELDRTENSMIFIERDKPLPREIIDEKLNLLRNALATEDDEEMRRALMQAVPTYHTPEEVNSEAVKSLEMKQAAG